MIRLGESAETKEDVEKARAILKSQLRNGELKESFLCNMFLKVCATAGDTAAAVETYEEMLRKGINPTNKTFGKIIQCFAKHGDIESAKQWADERERRIDDKMTSMATRTYISNMLIEACAKAGDLESAESVFKKMIDEGIRPDGITLSSILGVCASVPDTVRMEYWIKQMRQLGIEFDKVHYVHVTHAYAEAGMVSEASEWVKKCDEAGCSLDQGVYSLLIKGHAKNKNAAEAKRIFKRMEMEGIVPDQIAYHSLMKALVDTDDTKGAEELVETMRARGVQPGSVTYGMLILHYAKIGEDEKAAAVLARCREDGSTLPVTSYTSILKCYGQLRRPEMAFQWLKELQNDGLVPDNSISTAIVHALVNVQRFEEAERWLETFRSESLASSTLTVNADAYNMYILGLSRIGAIEKARETLQMMDHHRIEANEFTYFALIRCCAHKRRVEAGLAFEYLQEMKNKGLKPDVFTYSQVVNAYAKIGQVERVEALVQEMYANDIQPSVHTYTMVLSGIKNSMLEQKEAEERILDLLKSMKERGVPPNMRTYNEALRALRQFKAYESARKLFLDAMENKERFDSYTLEAIKHIPGLERFSLLMKKRLGMLDRGRRKTPRENTKEQINRKQRQHAARDAEAELLEGIRNYRPN